MASMCRGEFHDVSFDKDCDITLMGIRDYVELLMGDGVGFGIDVVSETV